MPLLPDDGGDLGLRHALGLLDPLPELREVQHGRGGRRARRRGALAGEGLRRSAISFHHLIQPAIRVEPILGVRVTGVATFREICWSLSRSDSISLESTP